MSSERCLIYPALDVSRGLILLRVYAYLRNVLIAVQNSAPKKSRNLLNTSIEKFTNLKINKKLICFKELG